MRSSRGRRAPRSSRFGTRLTRVTRALRRKNRDQALGAASTMVADWDGGTRIGDALQAFLAVPRFAGFARGALALVLSDGLERGDPAAMVDAVARLARLAWRLVWLTPLAGRARLPPARPRRSPAILPFIDRARRCELRSQAVVPPRSCAQGERRAA